MRLSIDTTKHVDPCEDGLVLSTDVCVLIVGCILVQAKAIMAVLVWELYLEARQVPHEAMLVAVVEARFLARPLAD